MSGRLRLRLPALAPALAALAITALPAAAQERVDLAGAIDAALASHPSVVQAQAAVQSAALALRMAEIDHGDVTVSLRATPAAGSVNLAPWEDGEFSDVVDTFDADTSATVSAQVDLPWGMTIAGSYTAGVELDDLDDRGAGAEDRFTDAQSLSISQDLLPAGSLAPAAAALAGRRDDLRLAQLRLLRARSDVTRQVAGTFLSLIERTAALDVWKERLAAAERELANTRALADQQAADPIDLLNARIAAVEQRNAVADARALLVLDSEAFFADLALPMTALVIPTVDADALRRAALALLDAPAATAGADDSLAVLEAQAQLAAAELRLEQARRGWLPALTVNLDYTKSGGAPGLGRLSVSLTGSYTLYDNGRREVAVQQAEEQVDAARRALRSARSTAQSGLERSRIDLQRAIAADVLAVLRHERAVLQAEQAARRHAAGAISDAALADAALPLQEAVDAARTAVHALGRAYMALAIDLSVDTAQALAAIAG